MFVYLDPNQVCIAQWRNRGIRMPGGHRLIRICGKSSLWHDRMTLRIHIFPELLVGDRTPNDIPKDNIVDFLGWISRIPILWTRWLILFFRTKVVCRKDLGGSLLYALSSPMKLCYYFCRSDRESFPRLTLQHSRCFYGQDLNFVFSMVGSDVCRLLSSSLISSPNGFMLFTLLG